MGTLEWSVCPPPAIERRAIEIVFKHYCCTTVCQRFVFVFCLVPALGRDDGSACKAMGCVLLMLCFIVSLPTKMALTVSALLPSMIVETRVWPLVDVRECLS